MTRTFRAQLEADGSIYVLQADKPLPNSEFPNQPEGFPLMPEITVQRH
jgi:hypothetical protein